MKTYKVQGTVTWGGLLTFEIECGGDPQEVLDLAWEEGMIKGSHQVPGKPTNFEVSKITEITDD
jgi:hypothetical protein